MGEWSFEHSIYSDARRKDAWAYWSDMRNHAEMEPGVMRIELDGPFATGTTGRTITGEYTQELELTEVVDGRRFIVTGFTPDGAGTLSFCWEFEDDRDGTRMTHRIRARGPQVEEQMEVFHQMAVHAPEGMARLAAELNRLSREEWGSSDMSGDE